MFRIHNNKHDFDYDKPYVRRRPRNTGKTVTLILLAVVISVVSGVTGGFVVSMMFRNQPDAAMTERPERTPFDTFISERTVPIPETGAATEFAATLPERGVQHLTTGHRMTAPEVAAIVTPSVVEIKTEMVTTNAWRVEQVREGAGSGVVISADGYIVTNEHVISGARSVRVRLHDGEEHAARVVGYDVQTDIAVLKIEATGLTPAVFGDSGALLVGEAVLAVGNPLGELGGTVTQGIISALDREITIDGQRMTLLQTDAAVNPGNSGGGLFNMSGELIGVVNAKSGGLNIEGLGFAIPESTAGGVIADIMTYGFVRGRVSAGLMLLDIQTPNAATMHRVSQLGLYIAQSAHDVFQPGDRITAIDGRTVTNLASFTAAMSGRSIGDTISITVARGSQSITHEITLVELSPS